MTSTAAARRLTFLEYIELEQTSEIHHEFVDGGVYAMSGGSPEHSRLASK
jgi:Uma2 family endonuclease